MLLLHVQVVACCEMVVFIVFDPASHDCTVVAVELLDLTDTLRIYGSSALSSLDSRPLLVGKKPKEISKFNRF